MTNSVVLPSSEERTKKQQEWCEDSKVQPWKLSKGRRWKREDDLLHSTPVLISRDATLGFIQKTRH